MVGRLTHGIVQFDRDAAALDLLRLDQLFGEQREIVARCAQLLLGALAPRDLVAQVAIGVSELAGAQTDPRLQIQVRALERMLRAAQRGYIGDHQHRAGIGRRNAAVVGLRALD